ncbi:MAG TPA: Uma2 family endonuclease [Pseudonocardia sp.]|nr:Uma2 family endonuclease [Pseudonocardia sp.]
MTLSWPNHPITLEEWEALPEDSEYDLEVAEGMLVMSPGPLSWHQKAGMRLGTRFDDQLPREFTGLTDVEVVIAYDPLTIRAPHVIVTRTELFETDPPRYPVADVLLAVEILSTGTRRVDRILKFSEYAEAGIPQYWIVDVDEPASVLAYVLVNGTYELSGEHTGSVALDVAGHPVVIDLPALTRR